MTGPINLEVLVEEPSTDLVLRHLLPKIVPEVEFRIRDFQGKDLLLKELPRRLAGYASWVETTRTRVVVMVDRDDDDCRALKQQVVEIVERSALRSGSHPNSHVLVRVVVEELEAWYFGDLPALRRAYPRVPASLAKQTRFRDPDSIAGGTWESLEKVLKDRGYHATGLRKRRAAADIAPHMNVEVNSSTSFRVFRDGLRRFVSEGEI